MPFKNTAMRNKKNQPKSSVTPGFSCSNLGRIGWVAEREAPGFAAFKARW
jgi:hypothetical protein